MARVCTFPPLPPQGHPSHAPAWRAARTTAPPTSAARRRGCASSSAAWSSPRASTGPCCAWWASTRCVWPSCTMTSPSGSPMHSVSQPPAPEGKLIDIPGSKYAIVLDSEILLYFTTLIWCNRTYEILKKSANQAFWYSWLAPLHQASSIEHKKCLHSKQLCIDPSLVIYQIDIFLFSSAIALYTVFLLDSCNLFEIKLILNCMPTFFLCISYWYDHPISGIKTQS